MFQFIYCGQRIYVTVNYFLYRNDSAYIIHNLQWRGVFPWAIGPQRQRSAIRQTDVRGKIASCKNSRYIIAVSRAATRHCGAYNISATLHTLHKTKTHTKRGLKLHVTRNILHNNNNNNII